jgi:hypothetical protein
MKLGKKIKLFFKKLEFAYLLFLRGKKNIKIPLSDGITLYADVFRPSGRGPWPAIVTAVPYHKDDVAGAESMFETYDYLKAEYVIVLVDLRGHGSSEGITEEPLDCLKEDDLYELVEWCASQEWCDGKVGMKGESYGGMTALQAASTNPPSLKAIFDFMAPAFFYKNLAFLGGSLNMIGMCGAWLGFMNLITLFPPLYIKDRPDWKEIWNEHLDSYLPYLIKPSDHITYDKYWKDLDIPVEKITIPTLIMEGWWDFARDDGFQIYHKVGGPKKLCIGPWVHIFPSLQPLEQIDEVEYGISWFDCWLKGKKNKFVKEPPLSLYMMGAEEWTYADEWPPKNSQEKIYYLAKDGKLGNKAENTEAKIDYEHIPEVGINSGYMIVYPLGLDYPKDQSEDDAKSLAFDTLALDEPLEIVGAPKIDLTLSTDMPDAAITAKLCDVAPNGSSTLISTASRRLSFRKSYSNPTLPEAGKIYELEMEFFNTDYLIKSGHKLRLSIALSDFPRIFPLPYTGKITLYFGKDYIQQLSLELMKPIDKKRVQKPEFKPPDLSFMEYLMKGQKEPIMELKLLENPERNEIDVHGETEYELPLQYLKSPFILNSSYEASIIAGKPDTAKVEANGFAKFELDGVNYEISTKQLTSQEKVEVWAKILENNEIYFEKHFEKELTWVSLETKVT